MAIHHGRGDCAQEQVLGFGLLPWVAYVTIPLLAIVVVTFAVRWSAPGVQRVFLRPGWG